MGAFPSPRYGRWSFTHYIVADRQWRVLVNRIMGHPIGVNLILGRHSFGVCRPISGEERRDKQAKRLR